ncbi:hypothetical protein V1477_020620 [Vespula maculifrons]|uniref:Uncharacterized protein n=1 Tax=Vespula maculifrons TaxID=7453 RepID=A0ABD2AMP3_VESMC
MDITKTAAGDDPSSPVNEEGEIEVSFPLYRLLPAKLNGTVREKLLKSEIFNESAFPSNALSEADRRIKRGWRKCGTMEKKEKDRRIAPKRAVRRSGTS